MAGITQEQAQDQLDGALELLKAIRTSQEYQNADTSLKRALLKDASADVDKWDAKVKNLASTGGTGRIGVKSVIVHD